MSGIKNIVNSIESKFSEGGSLERWHPIYLTISHFLFSGKMVTSKGSHIRDGMDLKRIMTFTIIALLPCFLFGVFNVGHWAMVSKYGGELEYWSLIWPKFIKGFRIILPVLLVTFAVGISIEILVGLVKKKPLEEGFMVTGLIIVLMMPANVPLWMLACAIAFALIVGKEIFGGNGMNFLNVALLVKAFLFLAYPSSMSGLEENAFLVNNREFTPFEAMIGAIPGGIGDTSAIMALIGAVLLIYAGIISWKILFSFILGGIVMTFIYHQNGFFTELNNVYKSTLFFGGFAFGAVFLITDPVTATQTSKGKLFYGFFGGILVIIISPFHQTIAESVMMGILMMNILSSTIDHFVIQRNINRRLNRLNQVKQNRR